MKKALLILLLIVICHDVFAVTTVGIWRWRNNDGNEKNATWKAAVNTQIEINDAKAIRLRIYFLNSSEVTFNNTDLSYSTSSNGPWVKIKDDAAESTDAFVYSGDNKYIKNGQPTTSQIDTGTDIFYNPGRMVTMADTSKVYLFLKPGNGNTSTEIEWAIKPGKYVQPNTTYYFTSNNMKSGAPSPGAPGFAVLTTGNDIPTANATNDIIIGYNSSVANKQVTIHFETALKGHDHFVLQYSTDNANWSTRKTIPGDNSQYHQVTLDYPPPGTYYMRFLLFNSNDKMSVSPSVKTVVPVLDPVPGSVEPKLNVYPNPAAANVNFELKGYKGKTFTATMTNLYGKQVGKKTIAVNDAEHYTLETNAASGTYILNISGDNLAKSSRVLVQ